MSSLRYGKTPEPMSREFLVSRGHCCMHGCKNCPYKESLTNEGQKVNDIGLTPNLKKESGADCGRRKEAN
jgi:hypothetical protein